MYTFQREARHIGTLDGTCGSQKKFKNMIVLGMKGDGGRGGEEKGCDLGEDRTRGPDWKAGRFSET